MFCTSLLHMVENGNTYGTKFISDPGSLTEDIQYSVKTLIQNLFGG